MKKMVQACTSFKKFDMKIPLIYIEWMGNATKLNFCCLTFLKRPWLYSRWDFRDSFQKSVFHVIWCGNILKLPMVHIYEVPEPFFWKSAKCDDIWIFLPFWHNMLLVWLKHNNKKYGALWKRCLKVSKLKFFVFWRVFDVFMCNLTVTKKSVTECLKK